MLYYCFLSFSVGFLMVPVDVLLISSNMIVKALQSMLSFVYVKGNVFLKSGQAWF